MHWFKNSYGAFRSADGQFYLQQSPKKFYWLFQKQDGHFKVIAGPFPSAPDGRAYVEKMEEAA